MCRRLSGASLCETGSQCQRPANDQSAPTGGRSPRSGALLTRYLALLGRRKPSIAAADVARLKAEGLGASEIAKRLKIGRASVYWVLAGVSVGA